MAYLPIIHNKQALMPVLLGIQKSSVLSTNNYFLSYKSRGLIIPKKPSTKESLIALVDIEIIFSNIKNPLKKSIWRGLNRALFYR